jgi:hypothetical protein
MYHVIQPNQHLDEPMCEDYNNQWHLVQVVAESLFTIHLQLLFDNYQNNLTT